LRFFQYQNRVNFMNTNFRPSSAGIIWIRIAVVYLLLGVAMGIYMGASQNFAMRPVHAHVNLLGWATLALAGLIYTVFPEAGASKLAKTHFWLLNLALPVMMGALAMVLSGKVDFVPVLAASEIAAAAAIVAFAANLFLNLRAGAQEPAAQPQGQARST
jgi:hypothetical protein